MAISLTSTFLLVGTLGGMIHFYDLPSHQLLRTISAHKGLSITYLTSLFKPPDLIGHISLDLKVGNLSDAKDALPAKPVQPFQKMKDIKARDAHEVHMLLYAKRNVNWICSHWTVWRSHYASSRIKMMPPNTVSRNSSEIVRRSRKLWLARLVACQYLGWNRLSWSIVCQNSKLRLLNSKNSSGRPKPSMMGCGIQSSNV